MKKTVHIISHTHWDREWYLNSPYTNEWLIPFFDNLFAMLEKEPAYVFVLDGQMAMIEDYFEELDKQAFSVPRFQRRIKKYVEQKRLFIGPYYLQPDWQLLSEEALVRNLLYGHQAAQELGGAMPVGWLLDNFGQISQTAQIHQQCNLAGLYVWRGVEMDPHHVQSEFYWQAPDGTRIPAIYLLNSYRNVMRLAEFSDIMKERVQAEVRKLSPFATTSHILLMNGYDQEMVPDDIQPHIADGQLDSDEFTVIQSNPVQYIRDVMSEQPQLPTLTGALYSGRFIAVFPGVLSARMYLKLQNDEQQKALEKRVEPLAALVWLHGGEYEKTPIQTAWKTLLKNHPHDSICGVSIDNVHRDMENRTRTVHRLTHALTTQKLKELCSLLDTTASQDAEVRVVFNPSLQNRSACVRWGAETVLVPDIPALGLKIVDPPAVATAPTDTVQVQDLRISNQYIVVHFNPNGSFNLLDQATGRQYQNLGLIEDRADTGDEYNYSYPDEDTVYTSANCTADFQYMERSSARVVLRVAYTMELPVSDADGHTRRSSECLPLPLVHYYTIEGHSPLVTVKTLLKNTVKDHIMRVRFDTGIKAQYAAAGSPFDVVQRPIQVADYDESSIPEEVQRVIIGAREAHPNTIFLNREFVDLHDGTAGLAVLSQGLPEYQVVDESTIALTLFRAVGWIAKEINSRRGDAGPEILTPDAQCLREMQFTYAVYPHAGDTDAAQVVRQADYFNSEIVCCTTDRHPGVYREAFSLLHADDSQQAVKYTAVKRSEDGRAIIVRGFNAGATPTTVTIASQWPVQGATRVNLLEAEQATLAVERDTVALTVAPKQIFSVRLTLARSSQPISDQCALVYEPERTHETFAAFTTADYVTAEQIQAEERRAQELAVKQEHPLWRRTALEAQLSAILTRQRADEQTIRALGYGLNEARVQRRVYDYIKQFKDPDQQQDK